MYAKRCAAFILLVVIVGLVSATESLMDYIEEMAEKNPPPANYRDMYRLLLQRNALENASNFGSIPLEHLMFRKSQRSPSLRLRFGRSGPYLFPAGLPRAMGATAAAGYDNN